MLTALWLLMCLSGENDALAWSTFVAGEGEESLNDMFIEANGNVVIAGGSNSASFTVPNLGTAPSIDGYMARVSADGQTILTHHVISGSGSEEILAIAPMADGGVMVLGTTDSDDFPIILDTYRTDLYNGAANFVARLDANWNLVWSTFIGSDESPTPYTSMSLDSNGNIVLCGSGQNLPVTEGVVNSMSESAHVAKMASTGLNLIWARYLNSDGEAVDCLCDDSDQIYVYGTGTVPTTPGVYQETANADDVFVGRLDGDGAWQWASYFGGTGVEIPQNLSRNSNALLLTGTSSSMDLPVTEDALVFNQSVVNKVFYSVLDLEGTSLLTSGALGTEGGHVIREGAIDDVGNLFLTLSMTADFLPLTDNAFDDSFNGDDVGLLVLTPDGSELRYGSYYGGSDVEDAVKIVTNNVGGFTFAGLSQSTDLSTTPDAALVDNPGLVSAFVGQFPFCEPRADFLFEAATWPEIDILELIPETECLCPI